jgi:hypothetical protein
MITMTGGFAVAIGSGAAVAATPAQACAVSKVIEITHFAFNPPAVVPGGSSTATLTAQNCTDQAQQTTEIWSGRFVGTSAGTIPPGCPVIDPIAFGVDFPPLGAVSKSVGYSVPASCTATQLIVTADINGPNGVLLAEGTAVLQIIRPAG